MKLYRNGILSITGMLLMTMLVTLQAQDKLKLSVDQAVQTGIENSKSLKISGSKVKAAFARLNEVDANKYAWLKFTGSYTRLSPLDPFTITVPGMGSFVLAPSILDNYSAKLSLTQPLFTGNKISAGSESAEHLAKATTADFSKDKQDLILNIKNAYWTLYKASELKKSLDENVQSVEGHLKDAKNLAEQGLLTRNDVLKIEVQLSDIRYKLADAKNGIRVATIALNNLLGIALGTEIEIDSKPEFSDAKFSNLDQLLSTSYENRSELAAAEARIHASEAGVTSAKSGWYPQVSLMGNYTYAQPNQRIQPTHNKFDGTWDLSVGVSMDLWNWNTTSHQTEQAEAQLLQAQEAKGMAKDGITLEVTQNYLNIGLAKEKISISELAKQQAEENYRITGEKFKQGLALSTDLVDAEVAYLTAKTNYTTAVVDYEIALAKIQRSIESK